MKTLVPKVSGRGHLTVLLSLKSKVLLLLGTLSLEKDRRFYRSKLCVVVNTKAINYKSQKNELVDAFGYTVRNNHYISLPLQYV